MHDRYPINVADLRKLGAPWLTKVLRKNGSIEQDVTVININVQNNEDGGLLGEMCKCTLEFNKETSMTSVLMCKFQPADFMTKVTTRLFELCQHEYFWYKNIQPNYDIRIPQMIYGDFNFRAGSFIMAFECIDGEFYRCDVDGNFTIERAELMIKCIAKHHAITWGGEINNVDTSFCAAVNEGPNKMLIPESIKHYKTYWNKNKNPAVPNSSPDAIKQNALSWFQNFKSMQDYFANSPWLCINHGDPRLDNFFFNEKDSKDKIGLLDWQLIIKASCAGDLSWFVCTNITEEFAEEHWNNLLTLYLNELKKNLIIYNKTDLRCSLSFDELKEELGLAHVFSFAKIVIGSGGLDTNDSNNIKVMKHLSNNCVSAMVRDDTKNVVDRFLVNGMMAQNPNSATVNNDTSTETKTMEIG
jgi:hypothetical protein